MKTIHLMPVLLLTLATPFAAALAQRTPVPKADVEHVGQTPQIYEVNDLLNVFGREFPPSKMGAIEAWHPPEEAKARAAERSDFEQSLERHPEIMRQLTQAPGNLVEVLKRHMQPPFAESTERLECKAGSLIAHLMPAQHAWLNSFLRRLRDFDGYIEIETRIIEAPPAVLESLGLQDKSILSRPVDLAQLDERIRATGQCNLLAAPKLITPPAQHSSLTTFEYFKFVQDWSIEKVQPGDREIAVPKIAVIREGVALDLRALPVDDDHFAIELGLQNARVKRPVRTTSITVGSDSKQVEITLAEAESVQFDGTVVLASGASAILRGMSVDQSKALALIVTARKVSRDQR